MILESASEFDGLWKRSNNPARAKHTSSAVSLLESGEQSYINVISNNYSWVFVCVALINWNFGAAVTSWSASMHFTIKLAYKLTSLQGINSPLLPVNVLGTSSSFPFYSTTICTDWNCHHQPVLHNNNRIFMGPHFVRAQSTNKGLQMSFQTHTWHNTRNTQTHEHIYIYAHPQWHAHACNTPPTHTHTFTTNACIPITVVEEMVETTHHLFRLQKRGGFSGLT